MGPKEDKGGFNLEDFLDGTVSILGLDLDLVQLLSSPETVRQRLEELRARLKAAGGKEALSDEEWAQGKTTVQGRIRTRGVLGEREFHVGTLSRSDRSRAGQREPAPQEPIEPPVDVFDEGKEVVIVCDVPGLELEELDITVEDRSVSVTTKPGAPRAYRKSLDLQTEVAADSLRATCRNGVLEIRLQKREPGGQPSAVG